MDSVAAQGGPAFLVRGDEKGAGDGCPSKDETAAGQVLEAGGQNHGHSRDFGLGHAAEIVKGTGGHTGAVRRVEMDSVTGQEG